ncbi:surf-like protein [Friedmanniomyces endolithicus]|uniref:SURF1-like protein n=1 Tax=Friedmanniomyces endolithicus TaxID=329885 RepID=A0AAN6J566_9PEZI|nr:surf-like protein [Friedmanniomyces endolithicus]KAK0316882.1 surf-like protein [Friedmanniomyces endolithicus]KAK0973680.1 surf-like protein [Friedmanniomyces endolithicus]
MDRSRFLWRAVTQQTPSRPINTWTCTQCLHLRQQHRPLKPPQLLRRPQRRHQTQPADDPAFKSIVDNPPILMRTGRRHNKVGLIILAAIPITAFVLGCWQVQRLTWKTDLMAKFEDRLVRDPLPLPPQIDPDAIHDFDYRRVYARGKFRHDKEMLIGPRLHDGEDGYLVITPLDRSAEFRGFTGNTTVLVCRGWVAKSKAAQAARPESLNTGEVVVEGLLREPWKKNSFTPDNKPDEGAWYFPDVYQMAEHTGSQPVWIEETMRPDLLASYDRSAKGIPIGRAPEVNLRNNHVQYIFTWFSLSLATTVMMWMVLKRPAGGRGRARRNTGW